MSDNPPVKLTKAQRELLKLLALGPREGITDARAAGALCMKRLAFAEPEVGSYAITPAGRALLDALKDEGEGR